MTRGHIAWDFFMGKIYSDTQLFLWPAIRNAGQQHAGEILMSGPLEWYLADVIPLQLALAWGSGPI